MKHKFIPLKAKKSPTKKRVLSKKRRNAEIHSKKRSNATQYLLYKKRLKKAELLRGNPKHADRLILSSPYANPYLSGVLSFRQDSFKRENARAMLEAIMDSYERTIFAGLDPTEVCFYWVLHTDHDRFELHFIIVDQNLRTGNQLKLARKGHHGDRTLFNNWQELINIAYQLPSPFDPAHERLLDEPADNISKKLLGDFYAVDRHIAKEIRESRLTNREEIVHLIESLGYSAKAGKDYFSVIKSPKERFRLRGRKYKNNFDFLAYYRDRKERSERFRDKENVLKREAELVRDYEISIAERRERLAKEHLKPRQDWTPIKTYNRTTQIIQTTQTKDNKYELSRDKKPLCWSVESAPTSDRLPGRHFGSPDGHPDRNQRRKQIEIPTVRRDFEKFPRNLRRISFRIKIAGAKIRRYLERRKRKHNNPTKSSRWTMFRRKPEAKTHLRPSERFRDFDREVNPRKRDFKEPDI